MVLEEQILILDDEQFNLELLSKSLAQHSLKTFTDQQAMLDQANAATPCILLDVSMPGLNGYEVCEELRKQSETSNTPILFVSGHDSLQARLKGYAAGGMIIFVSLLIFLSCKRKSSEPLRVVRIEKVYLIKLMWRDRLHLKQ